MFPAEEPDQIAVMKEKGFQINVPVALLAMYVFYDSLSAEAEHVDLVRYRISM